MSFLTRLRSFSRLPRDERRLAVRALGWIVAVRAGLIVLPFTRVRTLIAGELRQVPPRRAEWPLVVRRAVQRASRSLPGTTCLAQSIVAERLLRSAGHAARLSIGVATTVIEGAPAADAPAASRRAGLDAHAWVESGGVLVTGDDPHGRYQLLASFGPE
jgi:hypothetical protein